MPSADFYWRLKIVAWCCAALWYLKVNIFPDFSLMLHFTLFNAMFRICIFWEDWNMTPAWRWSSVASSTWKPSKWSLPFLGKKDRYQTETSRCLKITEKVSFNIASEASYVYMIKNGKKWSIMASSWKPETCS